jgi:solute carrier family 15 (oligopeptide transporter), member 1
VTESPSTAPVSTNHPKGFFFLFAGEFAERFSFYGMRAILPLYLSDQMGYGEADGAFYYTIFLGLCYFLPLLGGYIADNYFGKYWTIVGFSVPYVIGQFLVGIENEYLLVLSLGLLAMGTGVIKPNISTLMGITYDQQRPGQESLRTTAFQAFYMSINIGAFLSQLLVPMVRDATGSYLYAFLVPAVFMVVALGIFAAGKPYYGQESVRVKVPQTPEQTVAKLKVLGQVALLFGLVSFFWAVFDQSSYTWVFFAKTYMDRNILGFNLAPDSIQALNPFFIVGIIGGTFLVRGLLVKPTGKTGMKPTTKMFIGFLLTALTMGVMALAASKVGDPEPAIRITTSDKAIEILMPAAMTKNKDGKDVPDISVELPAGKLDLGGEKLTTASGVLKMPADSKLKVELKDVSIGSAGKLAFMNGGITFPDGKTLVFKDGKIDYEASRPLFSGDAFQVDGVYEATLKNGRKIQLNDGVLETGLGNALTMKSGEKLAEFKSKSTDKPKITVEAGKYLRPEGRVTVWWMALAFFVLTVAEVLISVTGLELAFVVAPQSMKGFITACWLLTVAVANWFINAPIAGLYPSMHPCNYFLVLTGAGLLVAILFIPVSRRFNRAMEQAKNTQAT